MDNNTTQQGTIQSGIVNCCCEGQRQSQGYCVHLGYNHYFCPKHTEPTPPPSNYGLLERLERIEARIHRLELRGGINTYV
jgi:hypothetical protein